MTKVILQMQSPKSRDGLKKRINRNFLNSISARKQQILKKKQIRWCYDFERETAIDFKKGTAPEA